MHLTSYWTRVKRLHHPELYHRLPSSLNLISISIGNVPNLNYRTCAGVSSQFVFYSIVWAHLVSALRHITPFRKHKMPKQTTRNTFSLRRYLHSQERETPIPVDVHLIYSPPETLFPIHRFYVDEGGSQLLLHIELPSTPSSPIPTTSSLIPHSKKNIPKMQRGPSSSEEQEQQVVIITNCWSLFCFDQTVPD